MHQELVEWLRQQAHELVRLARATDTHTAGKLETLAIDMFNRARELEKTDQF